MILEPESKPSTQPVTKKPKIEASEKLAQLPEPQKPLPAPTQHKNVSEVTASAPDITMTPTLATAASISDPYRCTSCRTMLVI